MAGAADVAITPGVRLVRPRHPPMETVVRTSRPFPGVAPPIRGGSGGRLAPLKQTLAEGGEPRPELSTVRRGVQLTCMNADQVNKLRN